MEIDEYRFQLSSGDSTGFTPINDDYSQHIYQCVMCFSLVLTMIPRYTDIGHSMVDPFQHHRDNCFGWQKV